MAGLKEWRRISNRPRCRGAVWSGQPTSQARDARCLAHSSAPIGLGHCSHHEHNKHTFESWGGQASGSLELPWYWEASTHWSLHWPPRPSCRAVLQSLPAVYLRHSNTGANAYNDMNTRSAWWRERQAQEVANPSKRRWGWWPWPDLRVQYEYLQFYECSTLPLFIVNYLSVGLLLSSLAIRVLINHDWSHNLTDPSTSPGFRLLVISRHASKHAAMLF